MPEVKCPKCGASMVQRIAKKGPGTGEKFYGCSHYPNCKATVPFESVTVENTPHQEKDLLTVTSFPRILRARERFPHYQVWFFETIAVPEYLLERLNFENVEEGILKTFSQWRVDFPIKDSIIELNEQQCQITSVLEKILNRGRITLTSPKLENAFKQMFLKTSEPEISLSLIESGYKKNSQVSIWLDSKEENTFYRDILPELLGENYEQFVLPQVEILSLVPTTIDTSGSQRVDFFISHPRLEEKIIVEIDGEQHKDDIDSDKARDKVLQEAGYTVIRIQAKEIQEGIGNQLSVLRSKLSPIKENFIIEDKMIKFINSFKFAHQIQLVLTQAIQSNFLDLRKIDQWHIIADLDEVGIFDRNEALNILTNSVEDFMELLRKVSKLYSVDLPQGNHICHLFSDYTTGKYENVIHISFSDKFSTALATFYVQNIYFPFHIANSSLLISPPIVRGLEKPEKEDLEYFLRYIFRKPSFWEGQYEGLLRILQGKDAFLLLPTGAGKSLVYQLASLLLPGRTVVIDPIISLMDDQIDNLNGMGIDRCISITSQAEAQEKSRAIQLFGQGEYLFVFVAPERFQTDEFRNALRTLTVHTQIALIVIDEAHCVSEWGHDFRTAYLNIGRTSRIYCESNGYVPPLLALTGTASITVLKDIQRELQIEDFDAIITPESFDRKNLKFDVIFSTSGEKIAKLKGYLGQMLPRLFNTSPSTFYQPRGKDTYSGLIFCPHVEGEFGIKRVADEIRNDLAISVSIYSGGAPKDWNPDQFRYHKHYVTKEFKRNKISVLTCTKAFGMGIDKPNIRYTIHFCIPPSIESFYQEAGRAGRDKKTAYCCIIASNDFPERSKKLLTLDTKVEDIDKILTNTSWQENDDITRDLYFHTKAFRGVSQEKQDIEEVFKYIGDISQKRPKILTIPPKILEKIKQNKKEEDILGKARQIVEKSLHRLLLIGVISDYTIKYSRNEFNVKLSGAGKEEILKKYEEYVANYYAHGREKEEVKKASQFLSLPLQEFIMEIVNLLLHFIYDVIEQGRRRALSEMVLTAELGTNEKIRSRILNYLQKTEHSESLNQIIADKNAGIQKSEELFSFVVSSSKASAELRGQVSRYLESYPDHPALLMLRALTEIFSEDKNIGVVKENFMASISSGLTKYGLNDTTIFEFAAWAISSIVKRDKEVANQLIVELVQSSSRRLSRLLIEQLPITLGMIPAWFLLAKLQQDCDFLFMKKEMKNGK